MNGRTTARPRRDRTLRPLPKLNHLRPCSPGEIDPQEEIEGRRSLLERRITGRLPVPPMTFNERLNATLVGGVLVLAACTHPSISHVIREARQQLMGF